MEKNDFYTKKIIILWVNYRTLHVKQPDVASGVRPKTKPLLREPNNYIKRASPLFSSFSVVRPTQFLGIIKKKRKQKRHSRSFLTLINSFNFKDEHDNIISRHKRFGGVSIHHTFAILSLFRFGDYALFSLRSRRLEVVGARKNGARERDTRISSRARSLSRPTSKCLLHSYMSYCFQSPP